MATAEVAHRVADELFERHGPVSGAELPTYRGHVHRVIGLTGRQVEVPVELFTVLGLAVFFHDAGIWFDGTWDYLPPSTRRAVAALGAGRSPATPTWSRRSSTSTTGCAAPGTPARWWRRSAGPT